MVSGQNFSCSDGLVFQIVGIDLRNKRPHLTHTNKNVCLFTQKALEFLGHLQKMNMDKTHLKGFIRGNRSKQTKPLNEEHRFTSFALTDN